MLQRGIGMGNRHKNMQLTQKRCLLNQMSLSIIAMNQDSIRSLSLIDISKPLKRQSGLKMHPRITIHLIESYSHKLRPMAFFIICDSLMPYYDKPCIVAV